MHNSSGFNKDLDNKRFEIISNFFKGKTCLEVGASEGCMTKKLMKKFNFTYAIEPDESYFKELSKLENKKMIALKSKLEDVRMQFEYCNVPKINTVICCNVLEHIGLIGSFLHSLREFGNKKTTFIFSIPNSQSYNRILGHTLDMIETTESLDKQDIAVEHKKMYDTVMFDELLTKNGFNIEKIWTNGYKPFPNSMMNKLPKEIKKYCLGMELKYYGAEIFVIAKKK